MLPASPPPLVQESDLTVPQCVAELLEMSDASDFEDAAGSPPPRRKAKPELAEAALAVHKLRVTSYELQATGYKLRATNKVQAESRAASH